MPPPDFTNSQPARIALKGDDTYGGGDFRSVFDRGKGLETHANAFIHTEDAKCLETREFFP